MALLGLSFWHFKNELLRYQFFQLIYLCLVAYFVGIWGLLGSVLAAFVGILLLETVNYIEHYGLRRQKTDSGRYERVQPCHSWNADYPLGRILLYELTRHSDHHYKASRKYQVLRHLDESPNLPFGYPAAMLLSLCPPFWFRIMNPHLNQYAHQRLEKKLNNNF
jgi:alkane 1-monooxygenase